MRVAVVHDWLDTCGGAEKVLEQILALYTDADLFVMVDVMTGQARQPFDRHRIHTSLIQRLPFARRHFRNYLPLMPFAVEQFDLSGYDLILSSSHCVAKGVKTRPGQMHICYCHTPMRYIWDMQQDYLRDHHIAGLKSLLVRALFHRLRQWDRQTGGVDLFVANSQFIAERIRRYYGREAVVIYPPVAVEQFACCAAKDDYYVAASRLVSQKKVALIVAAFAGMPEKRLVVIGDGPCLPEIRRLATANITVTGHLPQPELQACLAKARAFVFASLEDFGMVTVEAQACGTPVIAYGQGGSREIVRPDTGLFFTEQTAASLRAAVERFEARPGQFPPRACHENAQRFRRELFLQAFQELVSRNPPACRSSEPAAAPGAGPAEIDSTREKRV